MTNNELVSAVVTGECIMCEVVHPPGYECTWLQKDEVEKLIKAAVEAERLEIAGLLELIARNREQAAERAVEEKDYGEADDQQGSAYLYRKMAQEIRGRGER